MPWVARQTDEFFRDDWMERESDSNIYPSDYGERLSIMMAPSLSPRMKGKLSVPYRNMALIIFRWKRYNIPTPMMQAMDRIDSFRSMLPFRGSSGDGPVCWAKIPDVMDNRAAVLQPLIIQQSILKRYIGFSPRGIEREKFELF